MNTFVDDTEAYIPPPTFKERMQAFDDHVVGRMKAAEEKSAAGGLDELAAPAPRKPTEEKSVGDIIGSLIRERACLDCGEVYEMILAVCPDCGEKRLRLHNETQAAEKKRLKDKKLTAEWCEITPPQYRHTDWRNVDLSPTCAEQAARWVPDTSGNLGAKHSLCLFGKTGRGKTRAAFAILARFHAMGWTVYSLHAGDAWDDLPTVRGLSSAARLQYDDDKKTADSARSALMRARKCHLLLLDDVGKERAGHDGLVSEAVGEAFFSLVEFRLAHGLPIVWTLNDGLEVIEKRFGARGAALLRRLEDVSDAPVIKPPNKKLPE